MMTLDKTFINYSFGTMLAFELKHRTRSMIFAGGERQLPGWD